MSNSKYILKEVNDKALDKEFIELPKRLYKGNRNWVCPLDDDIKAVFDPAKNKLFTDGEAIRWVAYNNEGEVVGRGNRDTRLSDHTFVRNQAGIDGRTCSDDAGAQVLGQGLQGGEGLGADPIADSDHDTRILLPVSELLG